MISIRLLNIKLPQKTHNYRLNFILFNNVKKKMYQCNNDFNPKIVTLVY